MNNSKTYKNKNKRNAAWTVSNLCRGKPAPDVGYIIDIIPILNDLLTVEDDEVVQDTLWAYSYLTDGPKHVPSIYFPSHEEVRKEVNPNVIGEGEGPPQHLQEEKKNDDNIVGEFGEDRKEEKDEDKGDKTVLDLIFGCDGVMKTIIGLLGHNNLHIIHPALRMIGNICTSNDKDTQYMIELGILEYLYKLLLFSNDGGDGNNNNINVGRRKPIIREALWTISNITAGNSQQIQYVLNENKLLPLILDIMVNETFDLSKEAIWCISNAVNGSTKYQIEYIMTNYHVIPALYHFLFRYRMAFQRQIQHPEQQQHDLQRDIYSTPNIANFNPNLTQFTELRVALEGIHKILEIDGDYNGKYSLYMEQCGILKEFENLLDINAVVTFHNVLTQQYLNENGGNELENNQIIQNIQMHTLSPQVLTLINSTINKYFNQSPSQILPLLASPKLDDRKHCCQILKKQLMAMDENSNDNDDNKDDNNDNNKDNNYLFNYQRIIQCENMIKYLLINLMDLNGDIALKADITFIIYSLFKKLPLLEEYLLNNQSSNQVDIKKLAIFMYEQNVILPFAQFLLLLTEEKSENNMEMNLGKTTLMIMETFEMILKHKINENNDEEMNLLKFCMIKCDAIYAMQQLINNKEILHSMDNEYSEEIINISSKIMKQYFTFSNNKSKISSLENCLVYGYFRESKAIDITNTLHHVIDVCCYYGYDYSFETNKRRSSIIIDPSQSILRNSVSDIIDFQYDQDDVLLDLDFGT